MPNNTHKSAAVPFVNQKGERSMKRVKVERYVAGKKPSYAKDEDEEYYTTDEEEGSIEEEEYDEEDQEELDDREEKPSTKRIESNVEPESPKAISDDEDDDPRFRRLKALRDSKEDTKKLLEAQMASSTAKAYHTIEEKLMQAEEGDDEEEEEILQRHALARARKVEEPLGAQVILGEFADQQQDDNGRFDDDTSNRQRRVQTEDILGDFRLSFTSRDKKKSEEKAKAEKSLKEMLDIAKREAEFTAQVHKKVEEDKKKELEKDMLKKGDIGARDLEMVDTEDEDEELAYEEWKLREISRVLRDRSERLLETKAR